MARAGVWCAQKVRASVAVRSEVVGDAFDDQLPLCLRLVQLTVHRRRVGGNHAPPTVQPLEFDDVAVLRADEVVMGLGVTVGADHGTVEAAFVHGVVEAGRHARILRPEHVCELGPRLVPASEIDRLRGNSGTAHLSARNRFKAIVTDVKVEGLMAQVEMVVSDPVRLVAIVTRDAAEELGLREGMPATAIVQSTSVMVQS